MASALHESRALCQSPREIFPHRCRIVTAARCLSLFIPSCVDGPRIARRIEQQEMAKA
jgi:hypothetical protein